MRLFEAVLAFARSTKRSRRWTPACPCEALEPRSLLSGGASVLELPAHLSHGPHAESRRPDVARDSPGGSLDDSARSSNGHQAEDHGSDHEDNSGAKRGLVSTKDYSFDFDGDGVADELAKATNSYDKEGHLVASIFEDDSGADGVIDFRTTYSATYDKHGNLIAETSEDDYGADGLIDARAT